MFLRLRDRMKCYYILKELEWNLPEKGINFRISKEDEEFYPLEIEIKSFKDLLSVSKIIGYDLIVGANNFFIEMEVHRPDLCQQDWNEK